MHSIAESVVSVIENNNRQVPRSPQQSPKIIENNYREIGDFTKNSPNLINYQQLLKPAVTPEILVTPEPTPPRSTPPVRPPRTPSPRRNSNFNIFK